MRLPVSFTLILGASAIIAQSNVGGNLVPNPGFEEYAAIPVNWFYSGSDFTRVMKYWESPTGASPDAYGPKVHVPQHWRDKGFGQARAHGGQSMIGLTLYGCSGGKPHCREYIQTQLIEPLVPGQRYQFSYWARPLSKSLHINHLGIAFTTNRTSIPTDDLIQAANPIMAEELLTCGPGQWLQCTHEFNAASDGNYIVIGNFTTDEATSIRRRCQGECLPFAYYYIDDIVLKKLPPILDVPLPPDDLSHIMLDSGRTYQLNYIFFDSGKADFLPRSFRELNTLLGIMLDNPKIMIEIHGHTDNQGSAEFNHQLSLQRARNVVNYLTSHSVDEKRIQVKGFGNTQPIDDNNTDAGRSRNRRVEFHVVKL